MLAVFQSSRLPSLGSPSHVALPTTLPNHIRAAAKISAGGVGRPTEFYSQLYTFSY